MPGRAQARPPSRTGPPWCTQSPHISHIRTNPRSKSTHPTSLFIYFSSSPHPIPLLWRVVYARWGVRQCGRYRPLDRAAPVAVEPGRQQQMLRFCIGPSPDVANPSRPACSSDLSVPYRYAALSACSTSTGGRSQQPLDTRASPASARTRMPESEAHAACHERRR